MTNPSQRITATRYHDISCGHRVAGHESKCALLHGHNYRIHFVAEPESGLDRIGRVVDFSVLKSRLCAWIEEHWDHRFLAWEHDLILFALWKNPAREAGDVLMRSIVWVPFNPTAENMAQYLLCVVGPRELAGTGAKLTEVRVEETRKCSAEVRG